jgi:hypothetical protein
MSCSSKQVFAIVLSMLVIVVMLDYLGLPSRIDARLLSDTELRQSARGADPAPCNGTCTLYDCIDKGGLCRQWIGNPTNCQGSTCFFCDSANTYYSCDNSSPLKDCLVTDFSSNDPIGCGEAWVSHCRYDNPVCTCVMEMDDGVLCPRPTPVFTKWNDPVTMCTKVASP